MRFARSGCPEGYPVQWWEVVGAPRGDAETFSVDYHDANHSKLNYVMQFFVRTALLVLASLCQGLRRFLCTAFDLCRVRWRRSTRR